MVPGGWTSSARSIRASSAKGRLNGVREEAEDDPGRCHTVCLAAQVNIHQHHAGFPFGRCDDRFFPGTDPADNTVLPAPDIVVIGLQVIRYL
jgi:hypothetical protein